MSARTDHPINLFHSAEDGGYVADVPDLKSCSAFGATVEEALREVWVAKSAWLVSARKHKKPVPKLPSRLRRQVGRLG